MESCQEEGYEPVYAHMEAWLDEHPAFVHNYFLRKATRAMVDDWLLSRTTPVFSNQEHAETQTPGATDNSSSSKPNSGTTTPVRKISAHEFEKGGLLNPMVSNVDGTITFLSPSVDLQQSQRTLSKTEELKQLDERELIFELVKDICNDLDVRTLSHKILQNVGILTGADRCSLFLVQGEKGSENRGLVSKLFDVSSQSRIEEIEKKEKIKVAWGSGIVGFVAETGEVVNIPDAYKDPRFCQGVDEMTGYTTRSLLCMPIKDMSGDVMGVAQVINKCGGGTFNQNDEKVFSAYLQFCGIGLRNAQLYERSQLENKRNQVLLDLARIIFEEQSTIEHIVYRIMTHSLSLLQCDRCQVMLLHEPSKGSFSRVFDLESADVSTEDAETRMSPFEGRFPTNIGISGHVATTGETVNIKDAHLDERFDRSMEEGGKWKSQSILCMPIKNASGQIIGVIQLINKMKGLPFTKNDEHFVEAFAIFCGMGIQNTKMYEQATTAIAKQQVTLEVLSYHATAPEREAEKLSKMVIPSTQAFRLHDFMFDDFKLDDDETLKACLRMFMDLDLISRFHIDFFTLCRWLQSVKKNYRNVTYHNWRHAFNVGQIMFAIMTTAQMWRTLGDVECLSLLIACLCHDLDHRGTNNSFQIKSASPLARLYSTSTMEHHHFDQCIMILSSKGNAILSHVKSEEYKKIITLVEEAILATDLAVYFKLRGEFFDVVDTHHPDWRSVDNRKLLRSMFMTACDIAAITKPWEIQRKIATLVAGEFFEQGDLEKTKFNITPIDMMNRDKQDRLPRMQIGWIDSICMPLYQAIVKISDKMGPLLQGVRSNRSHWLALAEEVESLHNGEEENKS